MKKRTSRALFVALFAAVACAAAVAQLPAGSKVSGQVKDSAGKPQMGVLVEVFNPASNKAANTYTDAKGFYSVSGLIPGMYFVKATAASFLPSLRENVDL